MTAAAWRLTHTSLLWRLFSHREQHPAEINETGMVQAQRFYCGSSAGSKTDKSREVFVPGEMLAPTMEAWVVERHRFSVGGVKAGGLRIFVAVAALA
jgi:hypothetical protein